MDDGGYLKEVADALREAARLHRETQELIQQQFAFLNGTPRKPLVDEPARPPRVVSHRGPTNPLHQTWRSFVLDLQKLEGYARRERLKLTKGNVCQFGVDTVRTITRTMEWYCLASTDWPPSTWNPDEPRMGGAGEKPHG